MFATPVQRTTTTAVLVMLLLSAPTFAAEPMPVENTGPSVALVAAGDYWHGFVEFWIGGLKKQNGIVLAAVGIGIVCLFIITRGKWLK